MRINWVGTALLVLVAAALITAVRSRNRQFSTSGREEVAIAPRSSNPAAMVTWTRVIEIASGDAYQGPWRMNRSDFRYVDAPTVAMDDQGSVAVAWVDQSRKDIFFQMYGPDGAPRPEVPVNVSRSPAIFSWLPRMAIVPGDPPHVYLLWQEIVFSGGSHGGEILFARSADGGRSFRDPVNLSNSPAGAGKGRLSARYWHNGSLDLALGPRGELYAAWTEYEGALWFRCSTDGGQSFADPVGLVRGDEPQPVSARGAARGRGRVFAHGPARGPALAVAGDATIYLAWTVGEDPAADIRLARSDDGGRSFTEPRVVHASGGHADAPQLAVDGRGTVHLVWGESPAGPLERYHIRYARSTDGGRTFEPPREIAGAHGAAYESVNFPAVGLDGEGTVYVVWHLFPDHTTHPQGLGFSFSRDGGETFAPPSVVPGTADPELGFTGSLQGLLMRKLAVNRAGAVAVVNSTFQPSDVSRVRLILGRAARR